MAPAKALLALLGPVSSWALLQGMKPVVPVQAQWRDSERDSENMTDVDEEGRPRGKNDHCKCLNWAEVYKRHNIPCGVGMELRHFFKQLQAPELGDPYAALFTAWANPVARRMFPKMQGSKEYMEFCGFFTKFKRDLCVNERFLMKGEEDGAPSSGSWCYVDNRCQGRPISIMLNTDLAVKRCNKDEDTSLGMLSLKDISEVGARDRLDAGIVSGYAFHHLDKRVDKLTPLDVRGLRQSGRTYIVFSTAEEDQREPRWILRGDELWVQNFNKHYNTWEWHCQEDCQKYQQA